MEVQQIPRKIVEITGGSSQLALRRTSAETYNLSATRLYVLHALQVMEVWQRSQSPVVGFECTDRNTYIYTDRLADKQTGR